MDWIIFTPQITCQLVKAGFSPLPFFTSSLYPSVLKCDRCEETFNLDRYLKRHVDWIIFLQSHLLSYPQIIQIALEKHTIKVITNRLKQDQGSTTKHNTIVETHNSLVGIHYSVVKIHTKDDEIHPEKENIRAQMPSQLCRPPCPSRQCQRLAGRVAASPPALGLQPSAALLLLPLVPAVSACKRGKVNLPAPLSHSVLA